MGINLINWKRSESAVVLVENEDSLKSYIFVNEQKCSSVARKRRFCQKSVVFGAGPPHQPCILMWKIDGGCFTMDFYRFPMDFGGFVARGFALVVKFVRFGSKNDFLE